MVRYDGYAGAMSVRLRGLRYVDSSAAQRKLIWLSVDRLVHREASAMVYRSLNELAPDDLCQIFSRLSDVHSRALRNKKCDPVIPRMRTAYGQNVFPFRGVDT